MNAKDAGNNANDNGLPSSFGRWCNIGLRTAHVATMGILLGGHVYSSDPRAELLLPLWLCVGSGLALCVLEIGGSPIWFHQGRGLMTMAKLALIALVPFLWGWRVPILLVVVILASVGSHMPARFRYYSILYRKIIKSHTGPGVAALAAEDDNEKL